MTLRNCITEMFLIAQLTSPALAEHREGDETLRPPDSPDTLDGIREKTYAEICRGRDAGDLEDTEKDLLAERRTLCDCLAKKGRSNACEEKGAVTQWENYIQRQLNENGTDGTSGKISEVCRKSLVAARKLSFIHRSQDFCEKNSGEATRKAMKFSPSWEDTSAGTCWRVRGMTKESCLQMSPCGKQANLSFLPLQPPREGMVSGTTVVCHPGVQKAQALKDPHHVNEGFQSPMANWLVGGRASATHQYGSANCHGTIVEALGGNLLEDLPVESPMSMGGEAQQGRVEEMAENWPKPQATVKDFSPEGGALINMRYDSCGPQDCGTAKYAVHHPDMKPKNEYIFVDGMCIECFGRLLEEKAGLKKLEESNSWQSLVSGCILNQNDHSILLLYQNSGICYYYETTSPHSDSRLMATSCPELWSRFPRRWCPSSPATFTLK